MNEHLLRHIKAAMKALPDEETAIEVLAVLRRLSSHPAGLQALHSLNQLLAATDHFGCWVSRDAFPDSANMALVFSTFPLDGTRIGSLLNDALSGQKEV